MNAKRFLCCLVAAVGLVACSAAPPAMPRWAGVRIDFDPEAGWTAVEPRTIGRVLERQWVREGEDVATAVWVVRQHDFALTAATSAKALVREVMRETASNCSSATFNGPEDQPLDAADSWGGRVICARQVGQQFGALIDIRAVVDGSVAHVVFSEVRTPPQAVPGAVAYETAEDMDAFIERLTGSATLVRTAVRLCGEGEC
jgi:hypothetical protein